MNQSASASGIQKSRQIRHLLSDYGIVIAFFVLCITLSLVSENFLTWGNWVNVLRQTSINGILAIGMTYVILTKGIDLSVGSVLALCGLIKVILSGMMGILLIYAILSWVQPYSPIYGVLQRLADPLVAPIRKVVPLIGNVDFSALIALIGLQVLLMVLNYVQAGGLSMIAGVR